MRGVIQDISAQVFQKLHICLRLNYFLIHTHKDTPPPGDLFVSDTSNTPTSPATKQGRLIIK